MQQGDETGDLTALASATLRQEREVVRPERFERPALRFVV